VSFSTKRLGSGISCPAIGVLLCPKSIFDENTDCTCLSNSSDVKVLLPRGTSYVIVSPAGVCYIRSNNRFRDMQYGHNPLPVFKELPYRDGKVLRAEVSISIRLERVCE
jgi:hypothetical protein